MRLIFLLFAAGVGCYLLVLAGAYLLQGKMMFFPDSSHFGDCPGMRQRNAQAVSMGDIRYYVFSRKDPACWIVIFHGNAGSACDRVYMTDLVETINANIAVCEYPGYGGDNRNPGERLLLGNALDLVRHIQKSDADGLPVYLMGESLGTGVATYVASKTRVDGLILVSAYTSIAEVARHHYPFLPVKYLIRDKFPAGRWAKAVSAKAILFHGIDDDIIPIRFARRQVSNFKGQTELLEIKGCGHNDITETGKMILEENIRRFVGQQ